MGRKNDRADCAAGGTASLIDKAYDDKVAEGKLAIELAALNSMPGEIGYMHAVYTPGGQDVQKLKPLVPYSHPIHAKFYEMTEDYQEYGIPYDQIIRVLIDDG